MSRTTLIAIALAAVVLLAGCTGAGPSTATNPSMDGTDDPGSTPGSQQMATMHFYVSDQPNAIDDFEHLNVTIDRVVLIRAEGGDELDDEEEADDESTPETAPSTATVSASPTATATSTTTSNATQTATATATGNDSTPTGTSTDVPESSQTEESDDEDEVDGNASGRITFDVEERVVDLTTLQGANATLLSEFDVPAGSYSAVYLEVSEVNGTLTTGEQVNVKLPSEKLQLTKSFEVSANESIDFVFDIGVHKAGKSGKYILRPVISESGPDVPLDRVDREGRPVEEDESDDDEREREDEVDVEAESDLSVDLLGSLNASEHVTIEVTQNGSVVANASVYLDDEKLGTTDAEGRLTVAVPAEADSFELEAVAGEAEGELEVEFDDDDGEEDRRDDDHRPDDERGKSSDANR